MATIPCPDCRRLLNLPEEGWKGTAQCTGCSKVFSAFSNVTRENRSREKPHKRTKGENGSTNVRIGQPSAPPEEWLDAKTKQLAYTVFFLGTLLNCLIRVLGFRDWDQFCREILTAPLFGVITALLAVVLISIA